MNVGANCLPLLSHLQHEWVLIDSQRVEQAELVPVTEVLHLHAAHVQHLGVAPHHTVQQPLRRAAK